MRGSTALLPLASAAIAVAIALAVFGLRIANPLDTGWIFADMTTTQFGWQQYQTDRSHLYPMVSDRYSYPLPMPVAMFDPVPTVALLFKLLAPLLPVPFQYIGPLFLVSVALQALLAWALLREATPDGAGFLYRISLAIGSLLFATAPILFIRFYYTHAPLVVQWPLLLSLLVYMRSFRFTFWHNVRDFSAVLFLAATLNPYVMLMSCIIYGGYIARCIFDRSLRWTHYVFLTIPIEAAFAGLIGFGFLTLNGSAFYGSSGFGFFSSNFLSPIDPWPDYFGSPFIPGLNVATQGQYEGFGYAGLGVLFLFAACAAVAVAVTVNALRGMPAFRNRSASALPGDDRRKFLPLIAVILVAYAFAMSHKMAFGAHVIELPAPKALLGVLTNFRSSGRVIWVVIYTAMFISIALLIRRLEQRPAAAMLGLAAVLQIADLGAPLALMHRRFQDHSLIGGAETRFRDAAYAGLNKAHDRILFVPTWHCRGWNQQRGDYPDLMFTKFSNLVMDNNLPTNSFYTGRIPLSQAKYHCEEFPKKLAAAPADARTGYILSQRAFGVFGAHIAASHRCDFADDMFICRGDGGAPGLSERARAAALRARRAEPEKAPAKAPVTPQN